MPTLHQAKTHFSQLVRRVELGERVPIYRGSTLVGYLSPPETVEVREFGSCPDLEIPEDFDAPVPEIEAQFQ